MNNQNLGGHDRSFVLPENNIQIEELDKPISESEVLKAIHSLKRGKSPGFDGILGDFFIDAKDFMVPYFVIIYNKIYESGVYPDSWSKGLIVPIHKRGDMNDPNNYRGIMLISVFTKLFSLILRNRLNTWCEDNEVLNEFQFWFQVGRSTSDGIFILHSLVQHVLKNNDKLYCAFIDYEKAFDTVIHEALWLKLVENGISCKGPVSIRPVLRPLWISFKLCVINLVYLSCNIMKCWINRWSFLSCIFIWCGWGNSTPNRVMTLIHMR